MATRLIFKHVSKIGPLQFGRTLITWKRVLRMFVNKNIQLFSQFLPLVFKLLNMF